MILTTTTSLGCALIAICIWIAFFGRRRPGKLPPGPKGYPLVGNALQLRDRPWHTFVEWKKQYGDIVYLRLFNQDAVVLNSAKAAADLLDRRGSNYSERLQMPVVEHSNGGFNMVFMNPGVTWRAMRRASHEAMNVRASTHYYPIQMRESIKLAVNMLDSPEKHHDFMSKWRRDAKGKCRHYTDKFLSYFLPIKQAMMQKQEIGSSFCSMLAEKQEQHGLDDVESAWLAAINYLAGFETSESTFNWLTLAMIAFPEAQRKAQDELDRVIGRGRIPTLDDMDNLPYMRAVVKEVLRWRPASPMGVLHATLEDDIYEGYYIPKGCLVIPNVLAMNHDEETYGPKPNEFRPERFLNEDGTLKSSPPDTKDEGHYTFGFGHRICPGRHIANNAVFTFAILLWAMHLEPGKDSNRLSLEDEETGNSSRARKFSVSTKARFPEALEMLKLAKEEWV
ncbi:cytochrome p450 [Moniliophthora roreri MCA 2997]|uniref:Cytochrome p450 n=1 Tax=Moniliophthora roreri (strain MCA 2997) TaxID=1381753 RepID=V2WN33_MONRO|nr:cytochrome p450 [Moniliophthora roreri MCA 2997]